MWIVISFLFLLNQFYSNQSTAVTEPFKNVTKSGNKFVYWTKSIFLKLIVIGERIGQSEVPDARPKVEDRLFISETVEDVILDVGSRIQDDTIRTIFSNCLPSTLGNVLQPMRSLKFI